MLTFKIKEAFLLCLLLPSADQPYNWFIDCMSNIKFPLPRFRRRRFGEMLVWLDSKYEMYLTANKATAHSDLNAMNNLVRWCFFWESVICSLEPGIWSSGLFNFGVTTGFSKKRRNNNPLLNISLVLPISNSSILPTLLLCSRFSATNS